MPPDRGCHAMIRLLSTLAVVSLVALGAARADGFRGDGSPTPAFGGWGKDPLPADAAAHAGFDWFEAGYPGDARANATLADAGVRPFAYVDLSELDDGLDGEARYTGPVLRTNGDWGLKLVDV